MVLRLSASLSLMLEANFSSVATSICAEGAAIEEVPPALKPPMSTPDSNASISSCEIEPSLIMFLLLRR